MNFNKIAIIQLCYADFESLEISLACCTKLTNPNIHIYLLQNGRGTYDTERTYRVCKRYENLFPDRITVVDWIKPNYPYYSIRELLNSDTMKQYDYICKIDDDVFPITDNWIENLISCYEDSLKKYGSELAYVTTLVNNNPWGFKQLVDGSSELSNEFQKISISHSVGNKNADDSVPYFEVGKGDIYDGGQGSVWKLPFYARWIHSKTTCNPSYFIKIVSENTYKEVSNDKRYSINCLLFRKDLWNEIDINNSDDEYCLFVYCKNNNKKIIANTQIPMVHIAFFSQREENRDLIQKIRDTYSSYLSLNYPISLCSSKEIENENRLRWIENKLNSQFHYFESSFADIEKKFIKIKPFYSKLFRKFKEFIKSKTYTGS